MIATTTCSYFNKVNANTAPPTLLQNWSFASSTCYTDYEFSASIEVATGSLPSIANGFTYGETVLSVFVFLIFVIILWRGIVGFSIYNREIR